MLPKFLNPLLGLSPTEHIPEVGEECPGFPSLSLGVGGSPWEVIVSPQECWSQGAPMTTVGELGAEAGAANGEAVLPGPGRAPGPGGYAWQGHTSPTPALPLSSPAHCRSVFHMHFCLADFFLFLQKSSHNSPVTV